MDNNPNPAEEPSESYKPIRRSAADTIPGLPGKTLHDFWAWAYSYILENTQRAVYAEFLVAGALDIDKEVRNGWRSYDLQYHGKKIEVKASAYVQSWRTHEPSVITFGAGKRIVMDDETAAYGTIRARSADVWIFALFEPKSHPAGDVIDPTLSRFYVVAGNILEGELGEQKTASLSTIERLATKSGGAGSIRYRELKGTVEHTLGRAVL